jgi:hypothetical protein
VARGMEAVLGVTALPYLFGLVFLAAGSSANGMWIGTNNYLFDLASHQERPRYIAILNALASPGAVSPVVVGMVLKSVSYPLVFACLAVVGVGLFGLTWRMPTTEEQDKRLLSASRRT